MLSQRKWYGYEEMGGGGGCVKTLKTDWTANNVEVFGNTEKLSKIRLWLKDN
jgi:hypothetical protein